ncbi:hypothetical protein AMTR_s00108p00133690 [Amborella trichopoda]|uniref:Aminotransferase-like plant mobile domain-containing protein n=1 Tax=Amborella trichopoda TaxID=13333 RepID=W1NVJ1_AMBTC|nr:hypothetical protein AMTR_s00108p00133690 [Amborella trichopoda]
MLFFISVTIFADASVSTVPTRYLQFFEDFEGAITYAWGTVALAFVYRSLGKACTFKRRHFSGLATLMQNPYFKPDEVISDDRQQPYQTAMCIIILIFDDIAEPYIPDRVHRQFEAKQSIPRNPMVVSKRVSRQEDTDNGLPSEEYKAWYNLVSQPPIHNIANPPKDILQPPIQEEEDVVPAHEPQYIMRPRGYEDQLVSAVQTSIVMLAEALTLRQKWYSEVYNHVNNTFVTLSKFVPVDMGDVEARMEVLQCQYSDEGVLDEAGHDFVGESSRAVEDLALCTQPAVEELRRYNTRKKQYQPKRR